MTDWYVVYTQPRREATASLNLSRQGYRTYFPGYWITRRHARRTDRVFRPLFPRYLFVALDTLTSRWRSVLSTVGVCDLLRQGERPLQTPQGLVENLQRQVDEAQRQQDEGARFAPGDTVSIDEGPFAGFLAHVEALNDSDRISVLLNLLGRDVRAWLSVSSVSAILPA